MSADMWATITGYLVWAIVLLALLAVLLIAVAVLAERAAKALRETWFWRFGGPWRHVRSILDDPDLDADTKLYRLDRYQRRAQTFDRNSRPESDGV